MPERPTKVYVKIDIPVQSFGKTIKSPGGKENMKKPAFKALFLSMFFLFLFATGSAEEVSKEAPFTFVQICDTQLGMGGYERDVNSFKQAVKQINARKPDFTVICGDLVNRANNPSYMVQKNTLRCL